MQQYQQQRQQNQQRKSRQGSQIQQNRQQQLQQQQYYQDNIYPPLAPPAPPPPAGADGNSNVYAQSNNNNARPSEIIVQIATIPVNPINQEITGFQEKSDIQNIQPKQKEKRKYPSRADGQVRPTMVTCPSCKSNVTTVVETEIGKAAWIWCLISFWFITLFGLIFLCLPYCKNKTHYCPQCETPVGHYEKQVC